MIGRTPIRQSGSFPGPDLIEQIEKYKGSTGSRTMEVRCGHRTPDFDILTEDQRSYYFHWRRMLSEGTVLSADGGYCFLRLAEMANSDSNSGEVRRQCIQLMRSPLIRNPPNIGRFIFDYQLMNGINPDVTFIKPTLNPTFSGTVTNIMSYPQGEFEVPFVKQLLNDIGGGYDDSDALSIISAVRIALTAIDDVLHDEGTSILSEYGGERTQVMYTAYEGIPYFGGRPTKFVLEYTNVSDGRLEEFLGSIVRMCVKSIIIPRKGGKIWIPSTFPTRMRKIVTTVLEKVLPERDRGTRSPDLIVIPLEEYESGKESIIVRSVDLEHNEPSPIPKGKVREFRDLHGKDGSEYIPSGKEYPQYYDLRGGRLDYYLKWRDGVREHRYGRTDVGYLHLLMNEMVNDGDPNGVLDSLLEMLDVYGPDESITRTISFHILNHGLDCPSTDILDDIYIRGKVIEQVAAGGPGRIGRRAFEKMAETADQYKSVRIDDTCADVLNKCIPIIDRESRKRGARSLGIVGYYTMGPIMRNINVPPWITCYEFNGNRLVPAEIFDGGEYWMCGDMKELMKDAISCIGSLRSKKPYKGRGKTFSGVIYDPILESVTKEYLKGESLRKKKVGRRVEIDLDAVKVAEKDLEHVTEMMRIEDDPIEGDMTLETTVPEIRSDDSWSSFSSLLTDPEREYISSIISGDGRCDNRMDDSINAKAMDTIGDTVIENGVPVEDYLDELSDIMH